MKELEDYSWFPSVLRNYQTEFIGYVVARFHVYDGFIHHLQSLKFPVMPMSDLCSGSGEPAISIYKKSACFRHLTLSDKYPGKNISNEDNQYQIEPKDVLEMEFDKGTCYTMFNAFHHFSEAEKINIVNKIKYSGSRSFIVEILEPTMICFLKVLITTTVGTIILTPFIQPFSLLRLILTYVLPLTVITITYDGIVSVLKSRSLSHYQKIYGDLNGQVKIQRLKHGFHNLIILHIPGLP